VKTSFPGRALMITAAMLLCPYVASAQQGGVASPQQTSPQQTSPQQTNVPAGVRQAEDAVERTVRRFRIGVEGGVGLDPELIVFGVHGAFAPIFRRDIEFRPGLEFGVGEVTTAFGINLDVLYFLPSSRGARWMPYAGAGPNFGVSHRGFETDEEDDVEDRNRFDFSDTDFDAGFNFIAGVRNANGVFLEMKATIHGVSNVRLLGGFNF
jgi:hypothetical protein